MHRILDWKRFPNDKLLDPFYQHISLKYNLAEIDAIIVSDDRALEFVIEHRKTLFFGIPIIFCGVFESTAQRIIGNEQNISGIYEQPSVVETIEAALTIQPNPRAAYLVSDLDPSGHAVEQNLREALVAARPEVPIRSLSGMTIGNIEKTVSTLGKYDLVFIGSYSIDASGLVYTGEKLIQRVAQASATPVYVLNTHHLGKGALGGYLFSPYIMGKKTGELTLTILAGTPIQSIPPHHDSNYVMMFDHQVVNRFSITNIPKGSRFINQEVSFWEQHRRTVFISLIIFSLCIVFISGLLVILRRKHSISRDLAQKTNR